MPFNSWVWQFFTPTEQANPLIGGPDADLDLDGLTNFAEFMLAGNPRTPDAINWTTSLIADGLGNTVLALSLRRSALASGVTFFFECADSPSGPWIFSGQPGGPVAIGGGTNNGDGTETVTYRDIVPYTAASQRYMRVRLVGN